MVQYDFDDVGLEQLAHVPDGVAGGGHGRLRRVRKQGRYCTYKARFDHRLVALDVYDQAIRRKPEALYNLRDPVSARGMVAASHYGLMAVPFYRCRDVAVVGGHVYAARAAFSRPIGDSHDHGPASNIGERLSGKPAGCESRRDNGGEGHAKDLRRSPPVHSFTSSSGGSFLASSSSITGISSRIGNARRSALQMNSACALRWTSGPLQIGQTRISSSRESMNSFQHEFHQGRVEFGIDAHRDQVAPAEVAAFYRILFGHQHEIAIGELEICSPKRVVIRKRMSREREPHARKPREKTLGIADSSDRVQLLS